MRLTAILCYYKKRIRVPGLLYTGKHRIYPEITYRMKKQALSEIITEQENINFLSRPYITQEEDFGHSRDMGKKDRIKEAFFKEKNKKMIPHVYAESFLDHLNVIKKWE